MYDLFYVASRRGVADSFGIFDTDTFLLREYGYDEVYSWMRQGYQINGLALQGNNIIWRREEKDLIYHDDNFAFIRSSVPDFDDFYNLEVVALHGTSPCFSYRYNTWLTKNLDFLDVKVVKGRGNFNNLYEVRFFGSNMGYSILLANTGCSICIIYKDAGYVSKSSKLNITSNASGIYAYRN